MGFKEVSSLDADVTISIGKVDKSTGRAYPKQAEGYYLGNRTVENKRGESKLHFLQTEKGNLGVWGTTDLNRKLAEVSPGTMVRITSRGTKPTPNGDMYMYLVEVDADNTIVVSAANEVNDFEDSDSTDDSGASDFENATSDDDAEQTAALLAAERAAKAAKVQSILKGKNK